jgi:two-component system chemotaxis response regulator CheB
LLESKTSWQVREAEEKQTIMKDHIYLAPADYHLLIEKDRTLSLDVSEKVNFSRPSIDVSFESAAEVYGTKLAAILLSGANDDGVAGLKKVKACGGVAIVQNPQTAAVAYMPQQAINNLAVDKIINPDELGLLINQFAADDYS